MTIRHIYDRGIPPSIRIDHEKRGQTNFPSALLHSSFLLSDFVRFNVIKISTRRVSLRYEDRNPLQTVLSQFDPAFSFRSITYLI